MLYFCIKRVAEAILQYVDKLFPVRQDSYLIYITPRTTWDPNLQAVYARLMHRNRLVRVVDGNASKVFSLTFFKNWLLLARAAVIIFDHSKPFGINPNEHLMVNVWHGSPLKKIRNYLPRGRFDAGLIAQQSKIDLLVSSCSFDEPFMKFAFGVDGATMWPKGMPRNDYARADMLGLFNKSAVQCDDAARRLTHGFTRVVLWAPTYRGNSHEKNTVDEWLNTDVDVLVGLLESSDTLLLVRAHKFSTIGTNESLFSSPFVVDASQFSNVNILLRHVDALITDYSSIWVDFLKHEKPILFFAPDYTDYLTQHGFVLDWLESIPSEPGDDFLALLSSFLRGPKDFERLVLERQKMFLSRYHGESSVDAGLVTDELLDEIDKRRSKKFA